MVCASGNDPQTVIAAARWPDGVRCPRCGSDGTAPRPPARGRIRWRCRRCRYEFTVTSRTCLNGTKIPLEVWVDAAMGTSTAPAVGAAARRAIRDAVERTGEPPGEARLHKLVSADRPGQGPGPLHAVSEGSRRVLATLRSRFGGASAGLIATETQLSPAHTRRCLRRLQIEGFVERYDTVIMWGYKPRRVRVWQLAMTGRTIAALPLIGWRSSPPVRAERVPPQFWHLFWSGEAASELTVAHDALHIADTLIGGHNAAARTWALHNLPVATLRKLRTMRGYTTGPAAARLDTAIRRRDDG